MNQTELDFSPATGDSPMTDEERSVMNILRSHRGRDNAIKAPRLAQAAEITPRQLRSAIGHLIEFHHVRIGSTTKKPYGYFIIETYEDAQEACEQLRHRAMSCLKRMSILKRMTMRELMGQMKFEL